jgi:hypothetical protein
MTSATTMQKIPKKTPTPTTTVMKRADQRASITILVLGDGKTFHICI